RRHAQIFIGVNNTINGVLGFIATLIGGLVMTLVETNSWSFGSDYLIKGQQVLMAISGLTFFAGAIYIRKQLQK
ncbi:MAG: hypothetical protein FWG21_02405, partial [Oscillospiraceae bacterium]|nr:hypothetical protein [Oscillospiraceae bacterium]